MLFEKNSIIINLKNIEKVSKELNYDKYQENKETQIGLFSTLFHELRHLMLDTNIFLPETIYSAELASEENVEDFGNITAENMQF